MCVVWGRVLSVHSVAWDALERTELSDLLGWVARHFIVGVLQVLDLLIMSQILVVVRVIDAHLFAPLDGALLQFVGGFKPPGEPEVLPRFASRVQIDADAVQLHFAAALVFFRTLGRYIIHFLSRVSRHNTASIRWSSLQAKSFMPIHSFFFLSFCFLGDEVFQILLLAPHQLFKSLSLPCQESSFVSRSLTVEYFFVDADFVV